MQKKILSLALVLTLVSSMLFACAPKKETPAPTTAAPETTVAPAPETVAETIAETTVAQVVSTKKINSDEDYKKIRIGFCGMTLNNEYHIILANAVKKACEAKGIQCEVQAGAVHASVDEQLPIIENYISQKVDGIILVPAASDGLIAPLQACKEAGIPVINLDTQLTADTLKTLDQKIPFYGTDNHKGGQLVGEEFKKMFPEDGTKVAILRGVEGQTNDEQRYNGFLETAGKVNLVFEQHANWETDLAYQAIQNCLQANPELQAIYCENDLMGIGAYNAVEEAGKKDKIKIFSYDGISEGIRYVVDGKFVLTCAQQPIEMGRLGVENMVKILKGEEAEQYIDTGCAIIDSKNCKEKLAEVEEYAKPEGLAKALEGGADVDLSTKRIGFCGMTLNNEYHIILANAVKKACEAAGIKCEIQAGAVHASVDEQLPIIENYISQKVDGIILVPAASDGLIAPLQACKDANIPVINLDTQLTKDTLKTLDQKIPFYGTDNLKGGQLVGEEFKKMFPEEGTKVAILRGVQGQTNDDDRYNGFLKTAGKVNLVFEQHANWETDQAYTQIQNCLQANPDLQAIYCENDLMGIGAYNAVEEAGKKDQIKIFSYDGISEGIKYVVDGKFVLTCAQQPIEMGKLGVENMIKIFKGEKAEEYIDTGCAIIDSKNCKEKLAQVEEYAKYEK